MTVATFFDRPGALIRDIIADVARNIVRWFLLFLGALLILIGILIAPLPGPLGVPFTIAGLILILRNSFRLRRLFIRWQRKHPKTVFPMRKLLRKDPEVLAIGYQQALRIEKFFLPKSWRVSKSLRRKYFRRKPAVSEG